MDRRDFLKFAAASPLAAAACSSAAQDFTRAFELDEATVASLQTVMESGEMSARSITSLYMERIRL
ncbi:MAG TPA: twin-arginine translocation signal domain-containing protein, partial [Terriglobia bacterium]|nr:twin-arginine translocation signal domain-containing protein [Terriglobia bacterium]